MKQQIEQFIKDWTPSGQKEITPGEFKRDIHKLIQTACKEQDELWAEMCGKHGKIK